MENTHYVAEVAVAQRVHDDDAVDHVMDTLAVFAPSLHDNAFGGTTITITITGRDLAQATATALQRVAATGQAPTAVTVMTETERDARAGIIELPTLVSGAQAATHLGLTAAAVTARIRAGKLQGQQVGRTWVMPLAAITAQARTEGK